MKNNIFKFFIFITLTLQIHSSFAVELKLDNIRNKINDIKNSKEVVSGSPQFQMLSVLEDITNELNKTKISKSTIQDSLTILDTTDFIEEKFPQKTKLNFPENFLIGSNLSIADLANASYFLNSLNKRRIQKLKDLDKLSNKNNIMSKININIIDELKLEPLSLIEQLEKMPELDLVSLSSSINKTSSSIM